MIIPPKITIISQVNNHKGDMWLFKLILQESSRDRKERVHMVISTEYTIISRISNHVDDMVHVLLYHTGGWILSKEWSHQMGLNKCNKYQMIVYEIISIKM